jgi:hypothetical protein
MADHGVFSVFSAVAGWVNEHGTLPSLLVVIGIFLIVLDVLRSDYRHILFGARMVMSGFALIYLAGSVSRTRWRDEDDQWHTSTNVGWLKVIAGLGLLVGGLVVPGRLFHSTFQYLK